MLIGDSHCDKVDAWSSLQQSTQTCRHLRSCNRSACADVCSLSFLTHINHVQHVDVSYSPSEEGIKWNLQRYGPEFHEILVPRRLLRSSFVAAVQSWDVPKGLQEHLAAYWTSSEEQKAGTHSV